MCLIALGRAGDLDASVMSFVDGCLRSIDGVETMAAAPLAEPAYAWDPARRQFSSTLILREAVARKPPGADKFLVLAEIDLFIPMLTFVYGQAQLGGAVALLSLVRLREEFYRLPPNPSLFRTRVRKETLHEIGHAIGLIHCEDPLCTMHLSTNIQQLDAKSGDYCEHCTQAIRRKLAHPAAPLLRKEA